MPAVLVEYLEDEPVSLEAFDAQARVISDDERQYVESVILPGARQAAETRSGAAIRSARYAERLVRFPAGEIILSIGQVTEIERIEWRDSRGVMVPLVPEAYELVSDGRESRLAMLGGGAWPVASAVKILVKAGTDLEKHPSVRQWILLAAAWMYEQRELFGAKEIFEMPQGYADGLLASIAVLPRF